MHKLPLVLRRFLLPALLTGALLPHAQAQRKDVEFQGNIPAAPLGLAGRKLAEGPFEYATAEGLDIRVRVVARGIEYPTSLAFLPDGRLLVTTRPGLIRVVEGGSLLEESVGGAPESVFAGESGLPGAVHGYMDIALHPDFQRNSLVYLSYTKPRESGRPAVAIGRGAWNGQDLEGFEDIFVAPEIGGMTRIAFGEDGKLYATTGGADPQDLSTLGGKVLRLNDDGGVPGDNPFAGHDGARPEIYTYGHRSALGLAVNPVTGELWQNENGPNGGDEINVLRAGANYGWPEVSLGRQYHGPWQAERPTHEGFEPPIVYWMPAIAVSGMAFYTGDALRAWKGDVFVGSMRTGEIPGTGHLERILLNEKGEELRREALLQDLRQRVRDVRQGPDGLLYLATDEREGAILRIEPAR